MSSLLVFAAIAFRAVSVLAPGGDGAVAGQTVVVEGATIRSVGPDATARIPPGARVVDGRGKWLVPGLVDLHVHLFSPDDLDAYLVHGVTTVLNMHGEPLHLRLRADVRAGRRPGPTILTAGPTIDGVPPLNPIFLAVETPAQARASVARQKRLGYDAVKVYGTLRPDVFAALVAEARRQGLPLVGHVNRQVGADAVLRSGQALVAHAQDLLDARFGEPPVDAEIDAFADEVAASGVAVTANVALQSSIVAQIEQLPAVLADPRALFLSAPAYSQWLPSNNRNPAGERAAEQVAWLRAERRRLLRFVRRLAERGAPLVLGTDSPSYALPGVSALEELREMVAAGVRPAAALRSATSAAGAFLHGAMPRAARVGVVEPGARADLLLLSANPTASVEALGAIDAVVVRGRYVGREELDATIRRLQERNREGRREVEAIDERIGSGRIDEAGRSLLAGRGRSSGVPPIAEWVLWSKHDRLDAGSRGTALALAALAARLYPRSFSAEYQLARLLLATGDLSGARAHVARSLALAPENALAVGLALKLAAMHEPVTARWGECEVASPYLGGVRFSVASSGPSGAARVEGPGLEAAAEEVVAGAGRLWLTVASGAGPVELRLAQEPDGRVRGEFVALFGRNGPVEGRCVR